MTSSRIAALIAKLITAHGRQPRPPCRDPFPLILWEQVGYLAGDEQRLRAFRLLEAATALAPDRIATLPIAKLREIARAGGGIAVDQRTERMRQTAQTVLAQHGGDLARTLRAEPARAAKVLARFPMIGAPGAHKILLFAGLATTFALESNGLRVLLRVGVGREEPSYAKSYRSVMQALAGELPERKPWLQRAHLALRVHGQQICRRARPLCAQCPITAHCASAEV